MGKTAKRLRKVIRWYAGEYRRLNDEVARLAAKEDNAWRVATVYGNGRDAEMARADDARRWAAAWKRAAKAHRAEARGNLGLAEQQRRRGRTLQDERDGANERIATLEGLLRRWMAIPADITSHDHGLWIETDIALVESATPPDDTTTPCETCRWAMGEYCSQGKLRDRWAPCADWERAATIEADSAALTRAVAETTEWTPLGALLQADAIDDAAAWEGADA